MGRSLQKQGMCCWGSYRLYMHKPRYLLFTYLMLLSPCDAIEHRLSVNCASFDRLMCISGELLWFPACCVASQRTVAMALCATMPKCARCPWAGKRLAMHQVQWPDLTSMHDKLQSGAVCACTRVSVYAYEPHPMLTTLHLVHT